MNLIWILPRWSDYNSVKMKKSTLYGVYTFMPAQRGQCYTNVTVSQTADILIWPKTCLYKKGM